MAQGRVGTLLPAPLPNTKNRGFGRVHTALLCYNVTTCPSSPLPKAEILELAGNAARDNKKGRVTPRHILLAVANDEELNQVWGSPLPPPPRHPSRQSCGPKSCISGGRVVVGWLLRVWTACDLLATPLPSPHHPWQFVPKTLLVGAGENEERYLTLLEER